jgi:putative DNA methylase
MAGAGKTLTALGSYWKGRKPLILNKACILGCLLPATADSKRDLEIFEMLMAMDSKSLQYRLKQKKDKTSRELIELVNHTPYKELVQAASRPEECADDLFGHIWDEVNVHLGTRAGSFPELVEQLGMMRFGHRPRLADTFCGSGQIPFEAARLGCDVYASDLNPVACMLTWGAFNIVGGSAESREKLAIDQKELVEKVQAEIDRLGVESDGNGWRAKAYLYCLEVRCSQSGWLVPLLPSRLISYGKQAIAVLVPDFQNKRYNIKIDAHVGK